MELALEIFLPLIKNYDLNFIRLFVACALGRLRNQGSASIILALWIGFDNHKPRLLTMRIGPLILNRV